MPDAPPALARSRPPRSARPRLTAPQQSSPPALSRLCPSPPIATIHHPLPLPTRPHPPAPARTHARTHARTRAHPQDPVELSIARRGAQASPDGVPSPSTAFMEGPFQDFGGRLDYLYEPSLLTESGLSRVLGRHVSTASRMRPEVERFMARATPQPPRNQPLSLAQQTVINISENLRPNLANPAGRRSRTPG